MTGSTHSQLQRTVSSEGSIEGVGLHTGQRAVVHAAPAPVGTGLCFRRSGRPIRDGAAREALRCTSVGSGEEAVLTVEHLLAAAAGLGLTNLWIDVEGPEIPGLDGSAAGFVDWFRRLGISEQDRPAESYRLREPILCHEGSGAIAAYPHEGYRVAYVLDYAKAFPEPQVADFEMTPETFTAQVAPARTFCTEEEARTLRRQGLGLGATTDNTLVIGPGGEPVGNRLRFKDECARHKVLDLVGDLALLGFWLRARVVGLRSGHSLNRRLIEAIQRQRSS